MIQIPPVPSSVLYPNTLIRSPRQPQERVWCLTNSLGTLVTRRNGRVAIVGNCVGRIHRDGQPDPVMAYFLVSEFGADPIIVDVLGLKREQIRGLRDPNATMVENLQAEDGRMRRLAESFLRQRNESVPGEDLQEAS